MNIMNEVKKEQRVNDLLTFVVSFLKDLCAEDPKDENLQCLADDIECSQRNYNDYHNVEEEPEENEQEEISEESETEESPPEE